MELKVDDDRQETLIITFWSTYLQVRPKKSFKCNEVSKKVMYLGLPVSHYTTSVLKFVMTIILSFMIFDVLGETGEFTSPNYPSNYPANTLCTWKITGQPGKKIKVTFLDFDLQSGSGYYGYSCPYDWVRAFRGSYAYGWRFYE